MNRLPRQVRQRIDAWRKEMKNHLYTPVGRVDFVGFTTFDRLAPESAASMEMRPFPAGEKWGECWEYAWFRAEFTLPAECEGRRAVLLPGMGGEQLIYVDGTAAGSNDKGRDYVTLRRDAKAGETIRVLIESYAGHGARLENMGPCPLERPAIPTVDGPQCTVKPSVLAVWNEGAYQLHLDVEILCDLLGQLDETSLRYQKVAAALTEFTRTADFELPLDERHESFRKAREALRPAMECHNGSTAPTMWLLGQSHIDLAWLWPEEETWHKVARTYANQLALMDEYPEYRFLLCEPKLLDMLAEQHPELWQRVKEAYARGQIDADGAFYIECDTNLPSGESLIRQLKRGREWFRERFGVDSQVAWQPDTFGYSGVLPQILKKLDIPYFATQKLLRADPECQRFPYQNFIWEGIDGSAVQALSFFKNNAQVSPSQFAQRWEQNRAQQTNIDTLLYPFGFGDGGGGATRDMLENIRRMGDLEGLPRAHYGTLRGFFEETARQAEGNRWVGELYLSWHRGTYTTQRWTKKLAAELERELHDAELLLALQPDKRAEYQVAVDAAWDALMFCQFHDVAGGVGIQSVHEDALDMLGLHIHKMLDLMRFQCVMRGGDYIYNPLPWTRQMWLDVGHGNVSDIHFFTVEPGINKPILTEPLGEINLTETDMGFVMENRFLSATIDRQGRVVSLTDKRNGLPLLNPGQVMNDFRLYKNVEPVYDGWEMSRDWRKHYIDGAFRVDKCAGYQQKGSILVSVRGMIGNSCVYQRISLRDNEAQLQVHTEVDWQERRKLLKVHFESNVLCDDALHEIQFGHVKRPCHASHAFAADRYESCSNRWTALCEENRGVAILADNIRGVSTDRGEIALSLLRAPLVPDDTADRGRQIFRYAIMPFAANFADSGVVRAGYELENEVYHGGTLILPAFRCEDEHVILETVKAADDGSGDVILRLYEAYRTNAEATVELPYPAKVYESSMDERERGELLGEGAKVTLRMKPFEIRTLRVVKG